ncbi:MAG TPA: hypothetical protein PKY96_14965 [Flavobacteriales bacterium]|nr:hypothetical protein [Flavobacteriales bacterium]
MIQKRFLQALVLPLAFLSSNQLSAQAFSEGTNAINVGIGIGGFGYNYISRGSAGKYIVSPTFSFAYDRGVKKLGPDVLGIGGLVGFKTVKYEYTNSNSFQTIKYDRRWSNIMLGARATYHLNWWHGVDELDLYGGVLLGFNIGTYTSNTTRTINGVTSDYDDGYSSASSFPIYGAFAGVRYLFTDHFGVYAEAGYTVTALNAGLTFTF